MKTLPLAHRLVRSLADENRLLLNVDIRDIDVTELPYP